MTFNSIFLKQRATKRPPLYHEMYCADCGRIFSATNTGNPCKHCSSTAVTLASNWEPMKDNTSRKGKRGE